MSSKGSSLKYKYKDPDFPVITKYLQLGHKGDPDPVWNTYGSLIALIILSGTAVIDTDDRTERLLPGQVLIICPEVRHIIRVSEGESCTINAIAFDPEFILGDAESRVYTDFQVQINRRNLNFMVLDGRKSWHDQLINTLRLVISVNQPGDIGSELKIKAYLSMFMGLLAENAIEIKSSYDPQITVDDERIKAALNHIHQHYSEKLSLEDIANYLHISKGECCRCFKRSVAMTPVEYLIKYRIYESARLLKDPRYSRASIAQIAVLVGFNSFSYYSKQFKTYMGCSPKQYRNTPANQTPNIDFIS